MQAPTSPCAVCLTPTASCRSRSGHQLLHSQHIHIQQIQQQRQQTQIQQLQQIHPPRRRNWTPPSSLCHPASFCRRAQGTNRGPLQLGAKPRLRAPSASGAPSAGPVDESRLPEQWRDPAVAEQKAQELRSSLHQWLDDEFCPEPANEDISLRCARVVEACLKQGQLDPGDILVEVVQDLETFSFKDSFHGPFSSANAAIRLLMEMGEAA